MFRTILKLAKTPPTFRKGDKVVVTTKSRSSGSDTETYTVLDSKPKMELWEEVGRGSDPKPEPHYKCEHDETGDEEWLPALDLKLKRS
jgi:hypothetical protein